MKISKWRTAYDGLEEEVSAKTALDFGDEVSLTTQSGKDDADINVLLRRFGVTGEMPAARTLPQYGDFSGVADYQSALNAVMHADDAFMSLPADVRKRFDNDPAQLLSFLDDEKNRDEAQNLGLLEPLPAPVKPLEVRVVPDPTPAVPAVPIVK